jgi:DNA-binding NarL/FixJ family response regulator
MIRVCIADSFPVVTNGIQSYFQGNSKIEIVSKPNNFDLLLHELNTLKINILILEIELEGLSSIKDLKRLTNNYPETKIILFTSVSEKMYAPIAIKVGVSAYISKKTELFELEKLIINVSEGNIVLSESIQKSIDLLNKGKKADRLFKKLSTREIEVLRYLNDGKKNKEIAQILDLDEKTISTYKLRLLNKLNVTNLVDLLKKAKDLDVI